VRRPGGPGGGGGVAGGGGGGGGGGKAGWSLRLRLRSGLRQSGRAEGPVSR